MTQTNLSPLQFERLEQELENWRDQLAELSPYLNQPDFTKLSKRWDAMRQNLDAVFLNYGEPLTHGPLAMDKMPPLMDLQLDELELVLESLLSTKRAVTGLITEAQQRLPLLEQALNTDENPARLRRCLDKMRAIETSFQSKLLALMSHIERFNAAFVMESSLFDVTQGAMEQTKRIEGLAKANLHLEGQRLDMARWLDSAKQKILRTPTTPPPSAQSLDHAGRLGSSGDTDTALASLYASRDKIREARAYLEQMLGAKGEVP